jgi:hypothetical protein
MPRGQCPSAVTIEAFRGEIYSLPAVEAREVPVATAPGLVELLQPPRPPRASTSIESGCFPLTRHRALALLTTHPQIDSKRIALMGRSRGRGVAILAADSLRSPHFPRDADVAASYAHHVFDNPRLPSAVHTRIGTVGYNAQAAAQAVKDMKKSLTVICPSMGVSPEYQRTSSPLRIRRTSSRSFCPPPKLRRRSSPRCEPSGGRARRARSAPAASGRRPEVTDGGSGHAPACTASRRRALR